MKGIKVAIISTHDHAKTLRDQLQKNGHKVIMVDPNPSFVPPSADLIVCRIGSCATNASKLAQDLKREGREVLFGDGTGKVVERANEILEEQKKMVTETVAERVVKAVSDAVKTCGAYWSKASDMPLATVVDIMSEASIIKTGSQRTKAGAILAEVRKFPAEARKKAIVDLLLTGDFERQFLFEQANRGQWYHHVVIVEKGKRMDDKVMDAFAKKLGLRSALPEGAKLCTNIPRIPIQETEIRRDKSAPVAEPKALTPPPSVPSAAKAPPAGAKAPEKKPAPEKAAPVEPNPVHGEFYSAFIASKKGGGKTPPNEAGQWKWRIRERKYGGKEFGYFWMTAEEIAKKLASLDEAAKSVIPADLTPPKEVPPAPKELPPEPKTSAAPPPPPASSGSYEQDMKAVIQAVKDLIKRHKLDAIHIEGSEQKVKVAVERIVVTQDNFEG